MLPYSVILQNISNDTIKGINVVFRIEGQDGKIRPNSVLTTVLDALDKPVLTPTRYQFFCPSPTLYSAIRARQPLEDLARDGSLESARELSRERQISVAVESIITSSGTFLGPDSLGLFKALVARQDAEEWLAARLTALSGLPAAQKAELERLSQTQVGPSFGPFQRDDYNQTLRDHARGMLRQMELKRGDAPSEFIARVARSTRVRKP
jgi:hypothetical protein